jgi:hypothetical protein
MTTSKIAPKSSIPAIAAHSTSLVNLIAGLVAYTFREKKPSLNIRLPQALPSVAP